MGYHKLVMALCDVDLPKDETNSDWLARPLSENQLQYAAYDVYYLHLIYRHLSDLAMDKGRFDWVLQDGAAMGATLSTLIAPEQYYVKLKGAQRLSLRELAIARALCSWRERMARSANLPRSWVLKDSAIVSLARMQPRDEQQLVQVRDLPPATARKQGQRLLKEIQQALELPPQQWPPALPEQLQAGDKRKLAQIQQVVNGCAEQLSLAPELLMNRKQIVEATLRLLAGTQPVLPPDIDQWRRRLLEPPLQELAPV
jgi:ribonuclease D